MENERRTTVRIVSEYSQGIQLDLFPTGRAIMGAGEDTGQGNRSGQTDEVTEAIDQFTEQMMELFAADANVIGMLTATDVEFCRGCEFVRLLNPDALGYCQVHGDIDYRENDPRNHIGENI